MLIQPSSLGAGVTVSYEQCRVLIIHKISGKHRGVLISGCGNSVYSGVLISGCGNSVYRGVLIPGCWNRLYTEVWGRAMDQSYFNVTLYMYPICDGETEEAAASTVLCFTVANSSFIN